MATVLLVEDSKTINRLLSDALTENGLEVYSCYDVESAITQLKENAAIRLVITDIIMEGKDGNDLIDYIHQNSVGGVRPRIIAISGGSAGTVDAQTAVSSVAHRVEKILKKPFLPQDLLFQVNSQLGRSV